MLRRTMAVMLVLVILAGCGEGQKPDILAWVACKDAIKAQLKAPSTAEFPSFDPAFATVRTSSVTIVSYVDAENSFGAKLRQDWRCEVDYDAAKNTVSVQSAALR